MNIDWNGDLEVNVWDKERHPTNGWTDVVKIEKASRTFWVRYVAADGELYSWSATQSDGTMYAGKPFGQVRNKKVESIDWTKELECKVWGDAITLKHPSHDWMSVKEYVNSWGTAVEKLITLENGYTWHVRQDGSIHSHTGKVGQVRNKKKTNPIAKVVSQSVWYIENPKPSNLATFYFDKQGDKYTLTGWKNVMTVEEIDKKYGRIVCCKYFDDHTQAIFRLRTYYGHTSIDDDVFVRNDLKNLKDIGVGDVFNEENFNYLIKTLKQAGARLSTIIKDSKKVEKIEVVI